MGNQISQTFSPRPEFTENSLPDLQGKVYIVTGASAGVGKELARLLYSRNGTVYLAARNPEKANASIAWVKQSRPDSQGTLHFLKLDVGDLEGINFSAEEFLSKEKRLDVLFNNAGEMVPPKGSTTKQNHELQLGTNCLAPFLFTKLLTPLLVQTAKSSPAVWVSSSAADYAPPGGMDINNLDYKVGKSSMTKYIISKAGNILHALEYQKRYQQDGIVSISVNPGGLKSDLQRNLNPTVRAIVSLMLHPPVNGAYTELFAGLAPDVVCAQPGSWVIPWGRIGPLRKDLATGENGKEFWAWSEKQVEHYV